MSGPKVEAEIKAGKLQITNQPTAGYRCLGPSSGYDPTTNSVSGEIRCWQSIHFPFHTAAEIGFPDEADVPAGAAVHDSLRHGERELLGARDDRAPRNEVIAPSAA